jgi:hypothetical protein
MKMEVLQRQALADRLVILDPGQKQQLRFRGRDSVWTFIGRDRRYRECRECPRDNTNVAHLFAGQENRLRCLHGLRDRQSAKEFRTQDALDGVESGD